MSRLIIRCWKILKQYLSNCSIHGVRYLVNDGYSWFERLFWLIACVLCWWGCSLMIKGVIEQYVEHPIAVTAETVYADRKTSFPSIALCIQTTEETRKKYFKKPVGTLEGVSPVKKIKYTSEELINAYELLRKPCSEILLNCTWNDVPFNCCEEFKEIPKTGVGFCFMFNSYRINQSNGDGLKYYADDNRKYGIFTFDITIDSTAYAIYILNNIQVPIITTPLYQYYKVKKGSTVYAFISVQHMYNEDGVRKVSMERRNCRFADEFLDKGPFKLYSSDVCYLQSYVEQMVKYCNCVNFYYKPPPNVRVCNLTEMECLFKNRFVIRSPKFARKNCYSDCAAEELDIEHFEVDNLPKSLARFRLELVNHGVVRYRRYVVHTLLDVIVSIGSAIGLFMGASILSIFELPYWLFVRRDKLS